MYLRSVTLGPQFPRGWKMSLKLWDSHLSWPRCSLYLVHTETLGPPARDPLVSTGAGQPSLLLDHEAGDAVVGVQVAHGHWAGLLNGRADVPAGAVDRLEGGGGDAAVRLVEEEAGRGAAGADASQVLFVGDLLRGATARAAVRAERR